MPFMETRVVDARAKFVFEVQAHGNVAEACRNAGISRETGYYWLERFNEHGVEGLNSRSSAPKRRPQTTPEAVVQAVLEVKARHESWGPKKIRAVLLDQALEHVPASSTVGDILRRHGKVKPRPSRCREPRLSAPLGHATEPGQLWTADFKGQFALGNGALCYPLTVQDACSRMLLCVHGLASTAVTPVRLVFERLFLEHGLPQRIRTDNGVPFAVGQGLGLTTLSAWWLKLGIGLEHIRPGKPQENGRHERMHLTLKQETTRPAATDWYPQQLRFDDFVSVYNHVRPHEALGQRPPASVHRVMTRPWDGRTPEPSYPFHDLTRRVDRHGQVQLGGKNFNVSTTLAHETVGLRELQGGAWLVSFASVDLGVYDPRTGRLGSYLDVLRS